jgi:hypothetical protein
MGRNSLWLPRFTSCWTFADKAAKWALAAVIGNNDEPM